ncbi:MAG: hypothetical protein JWO42_1962 [Chloroflexi bacterium]|nr:hypothetical protein [Chloroflexota bacterium]
MTILSRRTALRRAALGVAGIAHLPSIVRTQTDIQELTVTHRPGDHQLAIEDLWPDRASYTPREPAAIHVALTNKGSARQVDLELKLRHLEQKISGGSSTVHTVPPGASELRLPITLPHAGFQGYGVDLEVRDAGVVVAEASTALDVLDNWAQAPRYGFLSDFAAGDPLTATSVHTLARYHINVVQFYDWMWRHYILMPPSTEFVDGMGRALSLQTVRAKVAACRLLGMAALGYAAVYGAEPEYATKHPDEMLYDASGKPYWIENLFYIMNIHKGNPWRPKILAEMARAVREVPFDGLHLDWYGFPKDNAFGPGPNPQAYDLSKDFPPFIDDARKAVRHARPGTRVIFNAVDNWPIEAVAPTTQDAVYIEVWPPYEYYSDLQSLILEARRLAPEKQVILAAYLSPLLGAIDEKLPPAETATRLASAAIWANGGFHLLMGENNGALCDPYYPKYATMMPDFARVMRRYYDFVVRYENVLSDRRLVTARGHDAATAARVSGHHGSPDALPGSVWTIWRSMPGIRTLSLINLAGTDDVRWNVAKAPVRTTHNLTIDMHAGAHVTGVFIADPDGNDPRPRQLAFQTHSTGASTRIHVEIPRLDYWTLLVARVEEAKSH